MTILNDKIAQKKLKDTLVFPVTLVQKLTVNSNAEVVSCIFDLRLSNRIEIMVPIKNNPNAKKRMGKLK